MHRHLTDCQSRFECDPVARRGNCRTAEIVSSRKGRSFQLAQSAVVDPIGARSAARVNDGRTILRDQNSIAWSVDEPLARRDADGKAKNPGRGRSDQVPKRAMKVPGCHPEAKSENRDDDWQPFPAPLASTTFLLAPVRTLACGLVDLARRCRCGVRNVPVLWRFNEIAYTHRIWFISLLKFSRFTLGHFDFADPAVADSRDGFNEAGVAGFVSEEAAEEGDAAGEGVLGDSGVAPDSG